MPDFTSSMEPKSLCTNEKCVTCHSKKNIPKNDIIIQEKKS